VHSTLSFLIVTLYHQYTNMSEVNNYCTHSNRLTHSRTYLSSISIECIIILCAMFTNYILVKILYSLTTITNTIRILLLNMSLALICHHTLTLLHHGYFISMTLFVNECQLGIEACKYYKYSYKCYIHIQGNAGFYFNHQQYSPLILSSHTLQCALNEHTVVIALDDTNIWTCTRHTVL
jgi:hypothetical protein